MNPVVMASRISLSIVRFSLIAVAAFLGFLIFFFGPTAFEKLSAPLTFPAVVAPALVLAGILNLSIVLILLFTAKRWLPVYTSDSTGRDRGTRKSFKFSRTSLLVLLPIAFAAFLAAPRLNHSFWGDEHFTMEFYVLGQFTRDIERPDPHPPEFIPATWTDALFLTDFDNHWLNTLTAKLVLTIWQKSTNAPSWAFSEAALRILPFLAGLSAIAAWFALARRIGLRSAFALGGAFLLALHPWFLRHIAEVRGYPFALLLLPLTLIAAWRALSENAIRPWFSFAIFQVLLVYAWPGSLLSLIALNLTMLFSILTNRETHKTLVTRWIISSLIAFAVLIQLTAPCFPQLFAFLQSDSLKGPIEPNWLRNLAAHFLVGIDAVPYPVENPSPYYLTLRNFNPIVVSISAILISSSIVIGAIHLRANPLARLIAISTLAPAVLLVCFALFSRHHLFHWYFLPALPTIILGVLAGLDFLFRKNRVLALSFASTIAVTWIALAIPQIRILRYHDTDPLRQSALAPRPSLDLKDPAHDGILTAHLYGAPALYDPHGYLFSLMDQENAAYPGLNQLMRLADRKRIPLTINVGFPQQARVLYPDLMEFLENHDYFDARETFHGLEPQFTRTLYQYRDTRSETLRH